MKTAKSTFALLFILSLFLIAANPAPIPRIQTDDPPEKPVKLIFIHHSCGANWLADDDGGLGLALAENNYYVSDTYYSWGPDSIGDQTDIPNWLDWFSGANSPRYLDALYNESEAATPYYTRPLPDPGGENEIILFKSCFPNSALQGNINDAPAPEDELTIANAKYVYNTILEYFATRPDKLFIAITAPPLLDSTYAENARAFNDWLVYDWLKDYPLNNVAVFDFHAVLTGPNNRHRVVNGQIEHVTEAGMNTLYYPTEDEHPSARGNQKATGEFVPLLNFYYNRWKADGETAPLVDNEPASAQEADSQPQTSPPDSALIDDFEGEPPAGSYGWESYSDDHEPDNRISCHPVSEMAYQGEKSLKIDYDIVLYSWATCDLTFDSPQNWSDYAGISFFVHAQQAETTFNLDLFVESPQGTENYVRHIRLDENPAEWQEIFIPWQEFKRVDWEENGGASFTKPDQIHEIAFGFETPDNTEEKPQGIIYIDTLSLANQDAATAPSPTQSPNGSPAETDATSLPCLGGMLIPLLLAGLSLILRR